MNPRPKIFYGYVLVAIGFVMQIVAWGIYNSFGVYFNALLSDLSWSRAVLSGAASLAQMMVGLGAIIFGNLNDRFGPRLLLTGGGIVAGIGFALMSRLTDVWQLYLFYGVIVGIGLSGMDIILLSTTARWFIKRRGMMSGVVKMGTGVGVLVLPILLTWLILNFGWRTTYLVTAGMVAASLIIGAQFLVKDPSLRGLLPDGQEAPKGGGQNSEAGSLTLAEAARTRQFFLFCVAYFSVFFCTCIVLVHIVPYVVGLGQTAESGALVLAVIGGSSIAGRLLLGTTGDRTGSRRALLLCFSIFTLVFIWLLLGHQLWQLFLFAVVYGFAHGGFYALISPVVAEYFGLRSHGLIFGCIVFVSSIGGALGPLVAGFIYDRSQSYQTAFLLLLGFALVGLISILASGSPSRKTVPAETA